MMDREQSPLMRIPAEIRIMIYEYLLDLDHAGDKRLAVRNKAMHQLPAGALSTYRRTSYRIIERSFHRQCFETTYAHHRPAAHAHNNTNTNTNNTSTSTSTSSSTPMHPEIMAVNRRIHRETSHLLYRRPHGFDFGSDIEAVVPFLKDLTPASRAAIQELTIRKDGPVMHGTSESDRLDWAAMCAYLARLDTTIPRLRIVVEGGRPTAAAWAGLKALSVSDLRLLALIKHDSMDWVAALAAVRGLARLEIVPRVRYLPAPGTTATLLFAAFSASIDTALVEYLQTECGLPAVAASLTAGEA
ncbi:hypothetical protein CORC01_05744 [Colletotrichum orchidophilum]|uniref:DUF7730 domain-containing protein n=1 Tax=Colletotrichum orchidophilum TaxID=1209926 RepID=A0A1G4BCD2_9PEZI|nr:uncharacterized protein CORC01_05744 [Colletotrichum orchidophilum]OHE99054.1 hypothetical protein CORC01_05744 [Colletotrichum orchidophilum]